MKEIQNIKPFPKFCYTIGMIPTSYKNSLSYEEQLLWFCDFLENTVIPTINNNGQAVEELQNLFTELKNYVDNYFDNLDVQQEINNKLDEMVEDGILQEIIADYLNSKAIFGFDNVEEMKNATNLINGSFAETLGYYSKNDGGRATYKIRLITNEDVVDNATIIALSNNTLVAELIEKDVINAKQFGAKADQQFDNTSILQYCINYCVTKKKRLFLPNGNYMVTNTLNCPRGLIMFGETIVFDGISSKIFLNNNNDIPLLSSGNGQTELGAVRLSNIYLVNNGYSSTPENNTINTGINLNYTTEMLFDNVYIIGFNKALKVTHGTITTVHGLTTYYNNIVFEFTASSTFYIKNSNIYDSNLVFNNIGNITVEDTHIERFKHFLDKNNSTYLTNVSFNHCNIVSQVNTDFIVNTGSIAYLKFNECAIRCNSIDYLINSSSYSKFYLYDCYVFGIKCYIRSTAGSLLVIGGHKIDSQNYDGSGDKPTNLSGSAVVTYDINDGVYKTNGGIELSFPRVTGVNQLCIDSSTGYPAYRNTQNNFFGLQFGKSGHTSNRPTSPNVGFVYFDTDLGFPIWWNGTNWIKSSGEIV